MSAADERCNGTCFYLGEINDSQEAAWCQTIEAFDEKGGHLRQIALLPW